MDHSATEERSVPAPDCDHFEPVEHQNRDFIKDGRNTETLSLQTSLLAAGQIVLCESLLLQDNGEHPSEEKTEEYRSAHVTGDKEDSSVTEAYSDPPQCSQEVPATPQKAINTMHHSLHMLNPPGQGDEDTSHSGSTASDETSSLCSSRDSDFFPQPRDHEMEQLSAANEVVCGHQLTMKFPKKIERVPDLAIPSSYPEQQASLAPNDTGSLLFSRDKWPPLLHDPKPRCCASADTMETDYQSPQVDNKLGSMVIGLGRRTISEDLDSPPLISPDIISDQRHFLEKGVEAFGKALNPLVSDVHNDPRNDVKFRVRKKIYKLRTDVNRHISTTEDKAVDPSECMEAFDGRRILKHLRSESAFRVYADILDISSSEFKKHLCEIIGRTQRRPNPSLTWPTLFDTLYRMRNFIDCVANGLEGSDKSSLAVVIQQGVNDFNDIIKNAEDAQQLLSQLTK